MSTISLDDPNALQRLKELLFNGNGSDIEFTQGTQSVRVHRIESDVEEPIPDKRPLGLWAEKVGPVWMADDFNDELPDSFWLGDDA